MGAEGLVFAGRRRGAAPFYHGEGGPRGRGAGRRVAPQESDGRKLPKGRRVSRRTFEVSRRTFEVSRRAVEVSRRAVDVSRRAFEVSRRTVEVSRRAFEVSR